MVRLVERYSEFFLDQNQIDVKGVPKTRKRIENNQIAIYFFLLYFWKPVSLLLNCREAKETLNFKKYTTENGN
jgi:hypothetical protein